MDRFKQNSLTNAFRTSVLVALASASCVHAQTITLGGITVDPTIIAMAQSSVTSKGVDMCKVPGSPWRTDLGYSPIPGVRLHGIYAGQEYVGHKDVVSLIASQPDTFLIDPNEIPPESSVLAVAAPPVGFLAVFTPCGSKTSFVVEYPPGESLIYDPPEARRSFGIIQFQGQYVLRSRNETTCFTIQGDDPLTAAQQGTMSEPLQQCLTSLPPGQPFIVKCFDIEGNPVDCSQTFEITMSPNIPRCPPDFPADTPDPIDPNMIICDGGAGPQPPAPGYTCEPMGGICIATDGSEGSFCMLEDGQIYPIATCCTGQQLPSLTPINGTCPGNRICIPPESYCKGGTDVCCALEPPGPGPDDECPLTCEDRGGMCAPEESICMGEGPEGIEFYHLSECSQGACSSGEICCPDELCGSNQCPDCGDTGVQGDQPICLSQCPQPNPVMNIPLYPHKPPISPHAEGGESQTQLKLIPPFLPDGKCIKLTQHPQYEGSIAIWGAVDAISDQYQANVPLPHFVLPLNEELTRTVLEGVITSQVKDKLRAAGKPETVGRLDSYLVCYDTDAQQDVDCSQAIVADLWACDTTGTTSACPSGQTCVPTCPDGTQPTCGGIGCSANQVCVDACVDGSTPSCTGAACPEGERCCPIENLCISPADRCDPCETDCPPCEPESCPEGQMWCKPIEGDDLDNIISFSDVTSGTGVVTKDSEFSIDLNWLQDNEEVWIMVRPGQPGGGKVQIYEKESPRHSIEWIRECLTTHKDDAQRCDNGLTAIRLKRVSATKFILREPSPVAQNKTFELEAPDGIIKGTCWIEKPNPNKPHDPAVWHPSPCCFTGCFQKGIGRTGESR